MMASAQILATLFVREAVRTLLRNKVRSALTALGITIGVAAVVLIIAVGQAGSAAAQAQLQALGDNLVWIEAGSRNVNGARTGSHGTTTLTLEDAEAIRREVPLIRDISPQADGSTQVIRGNQNWATRFRGESPDYLRIKSYRLGAGAMFSDEDVAATANKVVLGETVRQQLFGAANPVGELVRMNGQLFEVVGVLAPKGQSNDGRDQDDFILLPYTTVMVKLRARNITWLDDILCSALSPEAVNPAIDSVVALLRQRHHLAPGEEDDFNIRRPDEVIKAQIQASRTLANLLASLAMISLLVGGIGIMNVMLGSVAQRTREIGLRLAVGARELEIQVQFLGEAVVLSLLGGVGGIALTAAGSVAFEKVLGWPISVSPGAVALALLSSMAVGVFFGFYPAWLAARLDPIEALRHE